MKNQEKYIRQRVKFLADLKISEFNSNGDKPEKTEKNHKRLQENAHQRILELTMILDKFYS